MTATVALADQQYNSGGAVAGGIAPVEFVYPQTTSRIVVEWDLDNDGDFSESVEDVTSYVLAVETVTGRDWPSQLTGQASPGRLRATLNNNDGRFSHFNSSSPLNTSPFSLKTGRKLRIRTEESTADDPVPLLRDRFQRDDGPLGTADLGGAWSEPLTGDLRIVNSSALPVTADGSGHMAVLDAGVTDYYAQVEGVVAGVTSTTGVGANRIGLVLRYQDSNDYSLLVVTEGQLRLYDVVAGVETLVESVDVETYNGMVIGAHVVGATVTAYLEGVPQFTATAVQTDETEVGIYAEWGSGNIRPELDDFYVWDGMPTTVEGILWTGDLSDLQNSVAASGEKLTVIEGQGWLSRLAVQQAFTPNAGVTTRSLQSVSGRKTGLVVGNVLSQANLLHPPGPIDEGDVTTGPFGTSGDCLSVCRDFEETELGFLYETQEGPIGFDARSARSTTSSVVTFSDADDAVFAYNEIEPLAWRREIINQVVAGVSPAVPSGITLTTRAHNSFNVNNPLSVLMPTGISSGDLLLVACVASSGFSTDPEVWVTPAGWTELSGKDANSSDLLDDSRVYAKVADGTEDATRFTFATTTETDMGSGVAHIYQVSDWYGSLEGVRIGDFGLSSSNPPVVLSGWDLRPTLFVVFRFGIRSSAATVSGTRYPTGYIGGTSTTATSTKPITCALQSARRTAVVTLEDPGEFSGGSFGPFSQRDAVVVAVRGYEGDPPGSGTTVQRDDLDSQNSHNAIKTHRTASQLFASSADAALYAELVLDRYAEDRPILTLRFYATRSAAYRKQAALRRVSDRVTVVANGRAGLGISGDFFIESVSHRWSQGTTLWLTEWQLSPV